MHFGPITTERHCKVFKQGGTIIQCIFQIGQLGCSMENVMERGIEYKVKRERAVERLLQQSGKEMVVSWTIIITIKMGKNE